MICGASPHVVGVEFGLREESGDMVIVKPVLDLVVFATNRLHKPPIAQEAELVRDGRLTHPDRDGQITNTQGSPGQGIENLRPRRIAQRFERSHHELQGLFIRKGRPGVSHG